MSNSDLGQPLDTTDLTAVSPVAEPVLTDAQPITLRTVGLFLLGNRDAVLLLAAHRKTLWLGMLFVFSAAFAREYDGEDLLHEPWHLLLPLVASLATSFILFVLISIVGWFRHAGWEGFWSRYRSFLGLYWMTAPLAWLYAIPVERFLSAGDATTTNLTFLALVSLWRVILITRVLSILLAARFWQVLFVVMLFADTVALNLVRFVDVQVFAVMGGVRLTEAESALAGAKFLVIVFGNLSWPVWFIVTLGMALGRWSPWKWGLARNSRSGPIPTNVWALAIISILVWLIPMPWTQVEQQRRGAVERAFRAGRYSEMLALMSAHQRAEFPPHWDPPPRIGASRERPRILKVVSAFSSETAPWVRVLFCNKLNDSLGRNEYPFDTLWNETNVEELLAVIEKLPESAEVLKGKSLLLEQVSGLNRDELSHDSQRLLILLMKAAVPPDETVERTGYQWEWEHYLKPLEAVKDRQLVLKFHETHLRRILANPRQVPQTVQDRIRSLLSVPQSNAAPKP